MAINDLSPGFLKIKYAVGSANHVMTIPVKPVDPDPTVTNNAIQQANGTPQDFADFVDNLILNIKPFYNTAADFQVAELWSKPTPEDDPLFVELYPIGQSGTAATPTTVNGQLVFTFRTQTGGLFKLYLMSCVATPNQLTTAPFPAGIYNTLAFFLTSASSCAFGRDNGRIVAPIKAISKINDARRKKSLGL